MNDDELEKLLISGKDMNDDELEKLLAEEEALSYQMSSNNQGEKMMNKDNTVAILKSEYIKPLDKYADLMETNAISDNELDGKLFSLHKSHQTLVAIHVTGSPTDSQRERAIRFISSLNNHDTIKADFISVSDGNMYEGLVWTGSEPGGVDVKAAAKAAGYTQAVELYYLGGN